MELSKESHYDDKVFISICIFALMLACTVFLLNASHQDFYLDFQWLGGVQGERFLYFFCATYIAAIFIPIPYQRMLLIWKAIAMLCISLAILEVSNTAILTTPFPTEDYFLRHVDRMLNFHLLPILHFVHQHPEINNGIWNLYYSLLVVIHFLPIFLAFFEKQKVIYHYYCSFVISIIIGYFICYFFPTMSSPAAIYPHQYFTPFQLNTVHQFQLEHLHHIIHFSLVGGIVSFPSYHAIWAALVVYFLWSYQWIKYLALIYGILILLMAILTGWHYFFDLIGGLCVAVISIYFAKRLLRIMPDKMES
ncbi:MAG: phosphatase PAP2 family protein [Gammaproteobacteria bacterium]|nr:phosphatase PAP2 family protein [Gammaproteobacteria bacterium]